MTQPPASPHDIHSMYVHAVIKLSSTTIILFHVTVTCVMRRIMNTIVSFYCIYSMHKYRKLLSALVWCGEEDKVECCTEPCIYVVHFGGGLFLPLSTSPTS